jgi:hypothetical protein
MIKLETARVELKPHATMIDRVTTTNQEFVNIYNLINISHYFALDLFIVFSLCVCIRQHPYPHPYSF